MFKMRVAHSIDGRLTVQPSAEDLNAFPEGKKFDLKIEGRTAYLRGAPSGNCTVLENQPYCCGDYPRAVRAQTDSTHIPAFTVGEAEFKLIDASTLAWEIPADHDLDWTSRPPRSSVREVVRVQLALRAKSARASGVDLKTVAARVPSWARGRLPGDEWMSILTGA